MTVQDKILVFGDGRLGTALNEYFPTVTVLPTSEADITDRNSVERAILKYKPSVAINTAAVTSPALCESDWGLAWKVNVLGARNVAAVCKKHDVRSIHISSNWAVDPCNEYGSSKFASENVGFDLIIRTCYYDEGYWILTTLGKGDPVSLVETDVFNPISVTGLLGVLEKLLQRSQQGIVNVGTIDRVSHYDFGISLARAFGLSPSLITPTDRVTTSYEYPYITYLEPHPLSRISLLDDLRTFRETIVIEPIVELQDSRSR